MAAKYRLKLGTEDHEIEVEPDGAGGFRVKLGEDVAQVNLRRIDDTARYSLIVDHKPYDVFAEEGPTGFHIVVGGRAIAVGTQTGRRGGAGGPEAVDIDAGGEWVLKSPMAGVVQEIRVAADDEVEQGQVLCVVEAMKMQNELHARRGGTVKAVYVSVGQRVDQGTPLLVLL
jgi:acetyl-CoA/propionyl-CoA carboxylase biotin carboxyl carrier protein